MRSSRDSSNTSLQTRKICFPFTLLGIASFQDETYMHANMQSNKQMSSSISTADISIKFMPAYKAHNSRNGHGDLQFQGFIPL